MPEMPEVEAVCRRIRPHVTGRTIERARLPRPGTAAGPAADEIERWLPGKRIGRVLRRGKNILLYLAGKPIPWRAVQVHLRMTGDLEIAPDARLLPAGARMILELGARRALVFNDPRALGRVRLLTPDQVRQMCASLGPEPLAAAFTIERLAAEARSCRKPVKLFLLDQERIAGIGNIYAAEILHASRIHPRRPANALSKPRLALLHAAIRNIMSRAVQSASAVYGEPGRWGEDEFPLLVYGRESEPCARCGRSIRRIPQAGRSTYYCPGCQR